MIYLSNLLGKNVYFDRKIYGKMIDFAVLESSPNPSISKVVIKKNVNIQEFSFWNVGDWCA